MRLFHKNAGRRTRPRMLAEISEWPAVRTVPPIAPENTPRVEASWSDGTSGAERVAITLTYDEARALIARLTTALEAS